MRKVIIGGTEFVLLESDEIDCEHGDWQLAYRDIVVNPNHEFVQGYGSSLVVVREECEQCAFCGYVRKKTEEVEGAKEILLKVWRKGE